MFREKWNEIKCLGIELKKKTNQLRKLIKRIAIKRIIRDEMKKKSM